MSNLTTTEMNAWRGLLDTHTALTRALDAELSVDGLSLTEYGVLVRVQEAGRAGIRMTELASHLGLSGGGLTRLADRLERHGYIERRRCTADGRGLEALLTEEGRKKLKRVHVRHLRAVRQRFVDRLTDTDLASLAAIWPKLAALQTSENEGDAS
ncbi:MAG TPA: MarR family transcriptional regulator [Trueperaceae bacterium]|nr:MarR family transcriptional regulator [Trueperaceae bacterium]